MANSETAILAGGCFWGMQDLFRKLPGVEATRVGYSGGDVQHATYLHHGSHAEAIEVVFDPAKLSFRELLEFFFQVHDPTTRNRQGNDIGTSYRSAIYYLSHEQRRIAEDTIADVNASGLWPNPVVTEVQPAGPFWEAEPEHQDYLLCHPGGYTCHYPRPHWKLPCRASTPGRTGRYLEDFAPGQRFTSGQLKVSRDRIKSFAAEFDPQPFHLDEEAARASVLGGLAASGWHTAAMTMRLLVESELNPAGGIVGVGFDEFRWPNPTRPDDTLHLDIEVLEVRPSKSRSDQGLIKVKTTTLNQKDEPVQVSVGNLIVRRRPASTS